MKELGPFLPLYVDDLIGGTMHFGAEEMGAYILLLTHQWNHGYIENNPQVIERIARAEYAHLGRVLQKFSKCGKDLANLRMAQVREDRIKFMEKQRANGALGGRPKNPPDNPNYIPNETSPSPSPSPSAHPSPPARAPLNGKLGTLTEKIINCRPEFLRLHHDAVINCLRGADPATLDRHVEEFVSDAANMLEPPSNPIGLLRGYLRGRPERRLADKKPLGRSKLPD